MYIGKAGTRGEVSNKLIGNSKILEDCIYGIYRKDFSVVGSGNNIRET